MSYARSLSLVLAASCLPVASAEAQFGRGLPRYRAQETRVYQFGYTPTYEIVIVNASLQDLEFRLAEYKNERQKWFEPESAWIVRAGTFGTTDVMALEMRGYFLTRRGVRIPATVDRGSYYATIYVDEEIVREYERRDPKGAIAIRTFEGFANPDIPETRLTTLTDDTRRVRRAFDLLPTPYDRPGAEGEFLDLQQGSFEKPKPEDQVGVVDLDDQGGSTSGRLRQPGEELVVLNLRDAMGEIPAGVRFVARIGHDLAYRTETGDIDGKGQIRLFTTRDANVRIDFTIGDRGRGESKFEIVPSRDTAFNIRIR